MVSIQSSMDELERSHQFREAVLECYQSAVKNFAHYALELDEEATRQFRKHLDQLAGEIEGGGVESLKDSRATLRGLLREYRDRSSACVAGLREELAGTARALAEILEGLAQTDGDHETRLRTSLDKLRKIAASDPAGELARAVTSTAESIEQSITDMKKQHQLTVSQFMTEIHVLHKRIYILQAAANTDQLTKLANRVEITSRIREKEPGTYCLLLASVRGLARAEVQFGKEVGAELAAAFAKRLRNCLPRGAEAGRWAGEEFIAMVQGKKADAIALAKWMTENLSGQYVCLKDGKAVRPNIQLTVGIVDSGGAESPDRVLQRIDVFFGGRP